MSQLCPDLTDALRTAQQAAEACQRGDILLSGSLWANAEAAFRRGQDVCQDGEPHPGWCYSLSSGHYYGRVKIRGVTKSCYGPLRDNKDDALADARELCKEYADDAESLCREYSGEDVLELLEKNGRR